MIYQTENIRRLKRVTIDYGRQKLDYMLVSLAMLYNMNANAIKNMWYEYHNFESSSVPIPDGFCSNKKCMKNHNGILFIEPLNCKYLGHAAFWNHKIQKYIDPNSTYPGRKTYNYLLENQYQFYHPNDDHFCQK